MRRILFLIFIITAISTPSWAADLVSFESAEGMKRLERSQAKVDFFPLANHFESQQNKVFCGVASSVIVLNTLRLRNPDFAIPQDNALLSKDERHYLPKGLDPVFHRYTQRSLLQHETVKSEMEVLGKPIPVNGKIISDYGLQLSQLSALLKSYGLNVTTRVANDALKDETIRKELTENLKTAGDYVLVNYSRKPLGQEGQGHISPLAAYDQESDSFLVMDVDPNIADWTWIPAADLIAAMRTFDTVENRGYVLVKEGK
jgi:hypothetical protein